ncbi:AraC family transcriptional regulator [Variovorax sp. J22P168]|uniref:helix-turn-helix domain-containing protein n=1 Tax=Variovorax jilinensis TaxID=3053513 RepID=UPI0025781364|nr:AraC family transcriptional regulator [Variovorax sp. J22P168]MDM0015928.1 AraC family transcriptional regulator [Variovorax sp. J22P168]
MNLLRHGDNKFPQAQLLCSSGALGWRGIAAEMRSHPAGDLPPFVSNQIEITIAPQTTPGAFVSRKGWGQRQQTMVRKDTIWISPVGVAEDDIRISAHLPSIFHIYLSTDRLLALSDPDGNSAAFLRQVRYLAGVHDETIVRIGHALAEDMRNPSAASRMLIDSLTTALANRLAQRYSDLGMPRGSAATAARDVRRVRLAVEFMQAHLDQPIGLDEIAAAVAVSPFHFARLFRASTGIAPYRYLANLRMEQAKHLLSQGRSSLAEIASSMQFSTQANFARAFRQATGTSPMAYRRQRS